MKRTIISFLLVLCWPLATRAGDRVALVFDDQKISDSDRAALYELILETIPQKEWKSAKTHYAGTVATVVDHYYDYWFDPTESDPAKTYLKVTTQFLSSKIREANEGKIGAANGIKAGTTLLIPPLPVRAATAAGKSTATRTFVPETATYQKFASFEAAEMISEETPAMPMLPVKSLESFHEVSATSIEVDWKALQKALASGKVRLPKDSVLLKTANEDVELTFFSMPPDQDPQDPWVLHSPHAEDAAPEWQRLRDGAATLPTTPQPELWVVDWWDTATTGHGAKVVSVIHKVLTDLQLENALGSRVKTFDLNPKNNRQELSRILDAYEATYSKAVTAEDSEHFFKDARAWIAKDTAPGHNQANELTLRIDEFVVQSILWNFFSQKYAVVNLSWSMNRPEYTLFDSVYLDPSETFAIVAAGNNPYPIPSDSYPQIGAATNPRLVNVTYANPSGKVLGAIDKQDGVPVHVAARGDGFEFGNIHSADKGSSFASPFVAAYAWLKVLLDHVPTDKLRADLTQSTNPARVRPKMVRAGGLFDPESLFLPSTLQPHIVIDNQRLSLVDAQITVHYLDDGGVAQQWPINIGSTLRYGKISVFDQAGTFVVWRRSSDGTHDVDMYPVLKIVVTRQGQPPQEFTPQAFTAQVSDLCF